MFSEKTIAETVSMVRTDKMRGLSTVEAKKRQEKYGPNELAEEKGTPFLKRVLEQFMDPLIYVLMAAGIISVFLGEVGDAFIIAAVVILNAAVGLIQEGKAKKALDALKKMTRLQAIVRRNGMEQEIDAAELVIGDVVVLDAGRQVPADLRLTVSENLRIEESALTGESVPVSKNAGFTASGELPIGDQRNMAFMSTNVTAGRGEGIVTAVGMDTEIGLIAKMIHQEKEEETPLQKRLGEIGVLLSSLAVGLCFLLFLVAVWQKRDVGEMLITAISLAVAAVPEGLPAVVTIVLALSVFQMVKVNTIVRRLPSVETLGSVTVVCSDKTGTLTKNKMTVENMFPAGKMLGQTGNEEELVRAFCLCNDAKMTENGSIGDPTETALLEYGRKTGGFSEEQFPRTAEKPFDSERKMMTTVHKGKEGIISYTKGAPDIVLKRCTHYLAGGAVRELGSSQRRMIMDRVTKLSGKAYRVLGAAYKNGDGRDEENMTFLGIAVMLDPPREEVPHAVELFKRAHVRTIMITGDHKATAFAIAKRLGIAAHENQCMSGAEMTQLTDSELRERLRNVSVFARVSSDHKARIIQALKADGNIVAMTGDGVNDAPSLKAADVGIAMGMCGTDVAKQAADIVLTDDNFATIEKAIEQGRGIYENIKKSVIFLLSSNFGEIMTMFAAVAATLPTPLKASHILWVNLITDSLPALALGTDTNDGESLMDDPPRGAKESLFSRGGLACTVFYGVLIAGVSLLAYLRVPIGILAKTGLEINVKNLAIVLEDPETLTRCQTYAFTVLGLSELFHAIGMRNVEKSVFKMDHLENTLMLAAMGVGFFLQIAVTEIPQLVAMFQTSALTVREWKDLLVLAAMPMAAHEILIFFRWISERWNAVGKR